MISVEKNVHRRRFTTGSVPNVLKMPCTVYDSVQTNNTKFSNNSQSEIDLDQFFSYWGTISVTVNLFVREFWGEVAHVKN